VKCASVFLVAALVLCAGCASSDSSHARATSLPLDYFDSQQRCYAAWTNILDQWIKQTGGLRPSVDASRRMIAQDTKTDLSRLIRATWKKLGNPQQATSIDIASAFSSVVTDEVPPDCRTIIWLRPLLTEVPETFAAGAKQALLNEAPVNDRVGDHAFSAWLILQLLAPENLLGKIQ